MDAIGALARISQACEISTHTTFWIIAATGGSCLTLNITASDQYLAIVVQEKCFAKRTKDKGLAPENLSRTQFWNGILSINMVEYLRCLSYWVCFYAIIYTRIF
jgi:NhaC family Na+:H+ antiporter